MSSACCAAACISFGDGASSRSDSGLAGFIDQVQHGARHRRKGHRSPPQPGPDSQAFAQPWMRPFFTKRSRGDRITQRTGASWANSPGFARGPTDRWRDWGQEGRGRCGAGRACAQWSDDGAAEMTGGISRMKFCAVVYE